MNYLEDQNKERLSKVKETDSGASLKNKKDMNNSPEDKLNEEFPDYPIYPPSEDIYNIYKKEEEVDIEHPYAGKTVVDKTRPLTIIEKEEDDYIAEGLDIPGTELDDEQEFIGSEDEENNYYSLGGDNHENLDENSGEDYD
ncbi:MAG: hypothetical protein ACM3P1_04060 [Candidatus Saccharibacteria bacterium]